MEVKVITIQEQILMLDDKKILSDIIITARNRIKEIGKNE